MSNSTHSQQNQVSFPKDFIVILVHGWLSDESMMDDLVDTLRGLGMTESYWNAVFPNITITKDDSPTCNKFALIRDAFNQRPNSNVFIKVSFSDNEQGTIIEQSDELATSIFNLKAAFPTKKIATVGYSKGGVVSMECAIDHPGYIDKLISIGTPYTTTVGEHLYGFVEDCVQTFLNGVSFLHVIMHPEIYIPIYIAFANNALEHTLRAVVNSIINGQVVMPNLKQRWNQLSNRPSFTPIATRALTINGNLESDFIVPIESALASGFYGKKYSDDILLVKDPSRRITISTNQYTSGVFDIVNLVTKVNGLVNISTASGLIDFITTFLPFLFSVSNESSSNKRECAKYVHANMPLINSFLGSTDYQLKNETVALRVLAGLRD